MGLESGSGQVVGGGHVLMGSKDQDSGSEDSDMGIEAELIPSSFPPPTPSRYPQAQCGSGPWGHPQTAWLHRICYIYIIHRIIALEMKAAGNVEMIWVAGSPISLPTVGDWIFEVYPSTQSLNWHD